MEQQHNIFEDALLNLAEAAKVVELDPMIATILENPATHRGKIYELTGPRSANMDEIAKEYEAALGRPVRYINMTIDQWREEELAPLNLPKYVFDHFAVMAQLHADNRYDRLTSDVEKIIGKPSISVREYVASHRRLFGYKN